MNSFNLREAFGKSSKEYTGLLEIFLTFIFLSFISRLASFFLTKAKTKSAVGTSQLSECSKQKRQNVDKHGQIEAFLSSLALTEFDKISKASSGGLSTNSKVPSEAFRVFKPGVDALIPLDPTEYFRISIVGYYNVGKTSLAQSLFGVRDLNSREDVKGRLVVEGKQCEVTISHGSDYCNSSTGLFHFSTEFMENTSDAYVIVFGMEDHNDVEIVRQYLRMARTRQQQQDATIPPLFLVCNKRDLWSERDPNFECFNLIKDLTQREACPFVTTVLKANSAHENVDVLFYSLVKLMRLNKSSENVSCSAS